MEDYSLSHFSHLPGKASSLAIVDFYGRHSHSLSAPYMDNMPDTYHLYPETTFADLPAPSRNLVYGPIDDVRSTLTYVV